MSQTPPSQVTPQILGVRLSITPQVPAPRVVKLSLRATSASWPKADTYYSPRWQRLWSVTAEELGDALSPRVDRGPVRWARSGAPGSATASGTRTVQYPSSETGAGAGTGEGAGQFLGPPLGGMFPAERGDGGRLRVKQPRAPGDTAQCQHLRSEKGQRPT